MKVRSAVIGLIVSGGVAGVVVSCGGGGGGGGGTPAASGTFSVSGNVTGATAASVVKLNGGSDQQLAAPGGAFSFTGLADQTVFNVQVVNGTDRCSVNAGAGTVAAANVTGVTVSCVAQAAQKVVRSARLSGAQENPPVTSTGSGRGGIVFDPNTNVITGGVTLFNITPSGGGVGVFQAPTGNPTGNSASAAIIVLGSAGDGHTFFIPSGTTLTAGQKTALLAGELYFNVATAGNATGEIRGQVDLQGGAVASVAAMDFAQELAGGTDAGCTGKTTTGQGTLIIDQATRLIAISYMTHNVANADLSHIHDAPAGPTGTGPVIVNFVPGPTLAYPSDTTVPLTAQQITDLGIGYLYFNIHSNADGCPSGEIRGNLTLIQ
jgi:hypothetical protein